MPLLRLLLAQLQALAQFLREAEPKLSVSLKCALIANAVFWPLSLLGLAADHLAAGGQSPLLLRAKAQPDRFLSRRERLDLFGLAAANMLFVAPVVCCPVFDWMWDAWQRHPDDGGGGGRLTETDEWRWDRELLLNLPLHAVVAEFAFYALHRLLHSSAFLYRSIHRVHHRFAAPTAMACVYAHPLEFALGNILPIYLGPMLTNAHPLTCYGIWFPLAMAGTCRGHCGYRIGGWADPHEAHHLYYGFNYGGMGWLDRMIGTSTTVVRGKKKEEF